MKTTDKRMNADQIFGAIRMGVSKAVSALIHQTNNQMAIILGAAEEIQDLLNEDKLDVNELRDETAVIERSIKKTQGIMASFHTSYGRPKASVEALSDLKSVVSQVLAAYDYALNRAATIVRVEVEDEVPVNLSAGQLAIAVGQIVENFAEEELGKNQSERLLLIKGGVRNESAFIEISGNTKKISDSEKDHIFNEFYTTKELSDGHLGIGLAVARKIVTGARGEIEFVRNNDHNRFLIKLPIVMG